MVLDEKRGRVIHGKARGVQFRKMESVELIVVYDNGTRNISNSVVSHHIQRWERSQIPDTSGT